MLFIIKGPGAEAAGRGAGGERSRERSGRGEERGEEVGGREGGGWEGGEVVLDEGLEPLRYPGRGEKKLENET